jgi:acetyl-CoA synthetase
MPEKTQQEKTDAGQTTEAADVTEAQIAVHWKEEEYYYPRARFIGQANLTDLSVDERFSIDKFPECFKEYADMLTWDQYWHTTLDTSNAPFWKWFVGGKLNACFNCVDRHLPKYGNKAALIFVPEPEEDGYQAITYQELWARVNEVAAMLQDFAGLKTGDRVTLHLPMVPELPITMLACARLGVIHSEVFGGFSGEACGARIADSGSRVLITMDGYYRGGKLIDHKRNADIAVAAAEQNGQKADKVLIWPRLRDKSATSTPMVTGRDYNLHDVMKEFAGRKVAPVSMPAEAPLFLMYTSGTTGRPKGCQHSTGGYLSYVAGTSKYIQDIHPEDVYWCMADIGWITGHSYIVYGPLAVAATSVIMRGFPFIRMPGAPGGSPSGLVLTSSIPRLRPSECSAKPARTSQLSTTTTSNI